MCPAPEPAPAPPARFRRHAPLLVVAALVAVFFAPYLFGGRIFLATDALYRYYPWRHYVGPGFKPHNPLITDPVNYGYPANYNRQLKAGDLQDWNPYVMTGVPSVNSAGMGTTGRYYPPKLLLHRLLPVNTALMLNFIVHLLLMGVFMHLYLETIGAGRRGALFGAVAFMFSGCAMVWLTFETVLPAGAYLTALLYLAEKFRSPRPYRFAAAGSLAFGALMLIGHVQYNIYACLLLLFYACFLAWRSLREGAGARALFRLAACFGVTALGGVVIGAAEILPMLEVIRNSSRIARTFDFQGLFDTLARVPFRYLVTLVFPDYFGSPVLPFSAIPSLPTHEYMNYNELTLYLGVPTLFALLAAALSLGTPAARFFGFLTLLTLGMMTGTWAFYPFFKLVPGLDRVNPTRVIFLFSLVASVTAGLGYDGIGRLTPRRRRLFLGLCGALAAAVLALAAVSSRPGVVTWFNPTHGGWASFIGEQRAFRSALILKPLLLTLASAGLFAATALARGRRAAAGVFAVTLAVLGYDLISFGWYYNTRVEPKLVFPRTPGIEFLQRQPGPFRVAQDGGSGLFVNTLHPFKIEEVGGYTNLYPERYNRLASFLQYGEAGLGARRFDRWVIFTNHLSPLYDLLNVRYLLTAPVVSAPAPKYRRVFKDEIAIYENTAALPRAFVVHRHVVMRDTAEILRFMGSPDFQPAGQVVLEEEQPAAFVAGARAPEAPERVEITSYAPDRVAVTAELGANGWLVLSDTHYPGWVALLDGREAPILRADCNLRAVAVPAGRHEVVFAYRPRSVRAGLLLTWAGILGAVGFLAGGAVLSRGAAAPQREEKQK